MTFRCIGCIIFYVTLRLAHNTFINTSAYCKETTANLHQRRLTLWILHFILSHNITCKVMRTKILNLDRLTPSVSKCVGINLVLNCKTAITSCLGGKQNFNINDSEFQLINLSE